MKIECWHHDRISYALLCVVSKIMQARRKMHTFGTDVRLYEAEVHMIKMIREHEGAHVTALAELLGVTKGAVSQIVNKLEKKRMIVKNRDSANQSRLSLALTQKGETAYDFHERIHREFDEIVEELLTGSSDDHVLFLKNFLNSLESEVDKYL